MIPGFHVEGGAGLALTRGLSVAGLLAVFGALLFRAAVAPPLLADMTAENAAAFEVRWLRLFWWSWGTAILTAVVWLAAETAFIADAHGLTAAAAALPTVLADTLFGHLVLLRVTALALAAIALRFGPRRPWAATGFSAVVTALQAGHGHAASMYDGPSLLLLSDVVHLLAAGAWLGGLLPLYLLIGAGSAPEAARASRRFSPLATACVGLLAITASYQFWVLIGGLPGLIGTGYGLMALLKLALFAALLGFAVYNRFRLTPALATPASVIAKRRLARSIAVETGVGLLVVLAAGVLTSLPPSMHIQALWPFAQKPSLVTVNEDAGFRNEVIEAGFALAGALALLGWAFFGRRLRWPAAAMAAVIAWFAVPHLSLLLVPAYPTSFYHSPTSFAATTITDGSGLFAGNCAICHGIHGRGDGPAAVGMRIPPANLTAPHLWMHSDGELFWWISHGIEGPEGGLVMPGFAARLSPEQRWALIDYIRANNAGMTMSMTGRWFTPVHAPDLQAACGGQTRTLHDLRGHIVRLIFGPAPAPAASDNAVIVLADPDAAATTGGACVADDRTVPRAYAVVSGIAPGDLPGTQFLIDDHGWLRAIQRPGRPNSWNDPRALAAEIADIRAHPLAAPQTGSMAGMNMNMKM